MLEALRIGNVSAVLLDMYVPVARKDLFNETLYEVSDLLVAEIQHGVLLRGDSMKLASTMKKSIAENNVQFNFLKIAEPLESSEVRLVIISTSPETIRYEVINLWEYLL